MAPPKNLAELWPLVDGLIVGSTFKVEGQVRNPVDIHRVEAFMDVARALRQA